MLAPASACKGRDARPRGATLGLRFDRASPPRNRILYETVAALTTASVTASSSRAFNPITYAACKGHDAPRSRPIAEDSPTGRARHDPWPTPKQTPIGRGSRQRPCRFVCLRSCRIGPSNTELSCEAPLCSASSASTLCWAASSFTCHRCRGASAHGRHQSSQQSPRSATTATGPLPCGEPASNHPAAQPG
jgi:hypothetical protein